MSKHKDPQEVTILLVDNGSTRAAAALQLRHLAHTLSEKTGYTIHPVSLMHSDKISESAIKNTLSGQAAQIFTEFMSEYLEKGERNFIVIPLFFGKSRALTSYIPDEQAKLVSRFGEFSLALTDVLYPLPKGDPLLVEILYQNAFISSKKSPTKIVLVDHGSPISAVNDVRQHIAKALKKKLPKEVQLDQAVMERRTGKEYDFNGELLKDYLLSLAKKGDIQVTVLLLFLLPGTHAGKNGDIIQICDNVSQQYPNLRITISPLVSQNSQLIDCLKNRLDTTKIWLEKGTKQ